MLLSEFIKDKGGLEAAMSAVSLDKVMLCENCKEIFVWFEGEKLPDKPKQCPSCKDQEQGRPSLVQTRECLGEWDGVEIVSLPSSWEEFKTGVRTDYPCHRIIIKGSIFGVSWVGRIDIYANRVYKPGEIVKVRRMRSVHLVKQMSMQVGHIQKSPFDSPTHLVERTLPIKTTEAELPAKATLIEKKEGREYLVLEPSKATKAYRLVWKTAHTKTTLKGYGAQYSASLDPGTTVAYWVISGGVRSGRIHTTGVLALVDADHPLIYSSSSEEEEEIIM